MEIVRLSEVGAEIAALRAAEVLRAGGVILYPTDTLYGLGADALSDEAVEKVQQIKGREEGKPIHCIVADTKMAGEYGEFNGTAHRLAKEFLPGPLTIVVEKKAGLDSGIARGIGTIGIRIPKNEFCLTLARAFGKPYTTTSANASGRKTPTTVEGILEQLGESAENISLIIEAGELPDSQPSTVVGVSGSDVVVLREGAIPAADIWTVLGLEPREETV